MKVNSIKIIGTVLFLLILVCLVFYPAIAASETRVLTFTDHDPPSGPRYVSLLVWFDEIEKQTNGRIKIEPFFGGTLASAPEALKAVADGSVDIGFIFPDFFPKQLIAHNIFKLFPRGPEKWENIKWIYDNVYKNIPTFNEELEKENQKVLYITSALPAAMCATYPVSSIDDLKGKKWRASSRWHLAYLKNAGAIPVSVPWADCYMALQTGTMDGVLTDYDGMHMTKLDEIAKNIFISKGTWFGSPFLHTINLDVWNSLSKEDQDGILRASKIVEEEIFGSLFEEEIDYIIAKQKEMGDIVNFWSEEDLNKWINKDELVKLKAQWVKESKEAGLENASNIMKDIGELVNEAIERER